MRRHLTYANVIATLALCLAVGGGSAYAAVKLARNSVGSKQIKNHSVALRDLAKSVTGGPGSNGANGLQGPKGPKGDTGAAGAAGPAGAAGAAGKDLSFNGLRLGKLDFYAADKTFQFSPEVSLGKAGSTDIVAKCWVSSKTVFARIQVRRPAGAAGSLLVLGGTGADGYVILKPGSGYDVDYQDNPGSRLANQWAATLVDPTEGSTYDIRGLVYRQYAGSPLISPASDGCLLPQAQVEKVSR